LAYKGGRKKSFLEGEVEGKNAVFGPVGLFETPGEEKFHREETVPNFVVNGKQSI
jgi:hypothetical protein